MDSKGLIHLSNVGVETRNNEVIYIGVGEKVVRLGECGGKKIEKGREYTSSLGVPIAWHERKGRG